MVYIFAEEGESPKVTVVKANDVEIAKDLAAVNDKNYSLTCLSDSDWCALRENDEVLIRVKV